MHALTVTQVAQDEYRLKENYPHLAGAWADRDHPRCARDWHRLVNWQQLEKKARRAAGFAFAAVGLLTTGPILLRVRDQLK